MTRFGSRLSTVSSVADSGNYVPHLCLNICFVSLRLHPGGCYYLFNFCSEERFVSHC